MCMKRRMYIVSGQWFKQFKERVLEFLIYYTQAISAYRVASV